MPLRPLHHHRSWGLALAAAAWLSTASTPVAAAAADDAAFYRRAASCVAVLERDAKALAGRYQAGERALKPALVKVTEQGFAFVGRAYLRGLRKAEADKLTAEARLAQQGLSADSLQQLSSGCQAEGARLYQDANMLEQAVVTNRAKARVDALLAPPKKAG